MIKEPEFGERQYGILKNPECQWSKDSKDGMWAISFWPAREEEKYCLLNTMTYIAGFSKTEDWKSLYESYVNDLNMRIERYSHELQRLALEEEQQQ